MIPRFFTTEPAPLDVRVARVVAPPWPFAAYFLIRAPQVADGVMVPWPEAVTVTLLAAVLVPIWLYWVADLVGWRRDRPTPVGEPSPLELTADLSDHGTFEGDLRALVDAEAHGRPVPPRHTATNYFAQVAVTAQMDEALYALGARRNELGDWIVEMLSTDDRPTEPLLLTHEFTPAAGIRLARPDLLPPDSYIPAPTGRHRKPGVPLPPPTDDNALPYAFLNRSRELGF